MGRLSDTAANAALDAAIPASVKVALSTTQPTNTGSNVTEPSAGAYARASGTMGAAASRAKTNSGAVTFPTPTASWGSPGYFALYSTAATPVFLGWGDLGSAQPIPSGSLVSFADQQLAVSLAG